MDIKSDLRRKHRHDDEDDDDDCHEPGLWPGYHSW